MNAEPRPHFVERCFGRLQAYAHDAAAAFAIAVAGLLPHVYQTRLLKDEYGSIEHDPNADRTRGIVLPLRRASATGNEKEAT